MAYLDGWRGLAISLVLLAHFTHVEIGLFGRLGVGRLGVDLFFVLSGLLMSRILLEERTPLPTFYRRRVSRILPVFMLYLVVIFGAHAALGTIVSPKEALATAAFMRTYIGDTHIWESQFPLQHIWSLNVEEHSYIALSLVAALPLMRKAQGWTLIAVAACLFLTRAAYSMDPEGFDAIVSTEYAALPLLLSAGYRQVRHHFVPLVRPWMAPVALILGMACYAGDVPTRPSTYAASFLLAFAVNHIGESRARWIFELAPMRLLGLWSFSLYLWQQPFHLLFRDGEWRADVALAAAMVTGLASYYVFESPVRNWLNTHWRGAPRVRAETAT